MRYYAKFFQVNQRRLARELRIHQIAAHTFQNTLRIEHLNDAPLTKSIRRLRCVHSALSGPQRTSL